MSTRTMPQTHEQRVRELAELPCPGWERNAFLGQWLTHDEAMRDIGMCPTCNSSGLDPRFASLRGEHRIVYGQQGGPAVCVECHWLEFPVWKGPSARTPEPPYCLREDGDALDEAIAACGFDVLVRLREDGWYCTLSSLGMPTTYGPSVSGFTTPREAKSAALWSAVMG